MTEYIERKALVHHLENCIDEVNNTNGYTEDFKTCLRLVKNLPAADAAEVKHGKWIWDPNGMDWGLGTWQCSECACRNNNLPMNNRINPLVFSGSKYCPNCGAKMDLED